MIELLVQWAFTPSLLTLISLYPWLCVCQLQLQELMLSLSERRLGMDDITMDLDAFEEEDQIDNTMGNGENQRVLNTCITNCTLQVTSN